MANNSSAYETYRKLMGASAGAGSGTSAHGESKQSQQKAGGGQAYRLYQAYTRRENKAQDHRRETTVNSWANRYNQLQSKAKDGLNDDFLTEVSALIKDYNAPTGVRQNIGKLNQQQFSDAYQNLLSLQNSGKEWKAQQQMQAARAQTASGLLPEDANELARQRQKNIAQYESTKKRVEAAREELGKYGWNTEEYKEARSRFDALQGECDRLAGQIGDMDSMLTIYNRVDRFHADNVDALKGKAGFDTARQDYGAKAGERAEKANSVHGQLSKSQENLDSLLEQMKQAQKKMEAAFYNPDKTKYEEAKKSYHATQEAYSEAKKKDAALQDEYARLSGADELGEYLDWFNGLSQQNRQDVLTGHVNSQDLDPEIAAMPGSNKRHWERMTEDEINAYYYLANNEGIGAANKYLDGLQLTLDRRFTLDLEKGIEDEMTANSEASSWGTLGNTLRGVATVPGNLIGGPVAFIGNAIDKAKGKEWNPYSNANLMLNLSSKTRAVAAQDVYKSVAGDESSKAMNVLGEVVSNAYQAGLSTLDSLAGIATFGGGSIVAMGMSAASSRMRELYESGASDKEIYVGAIGSGILEALFEKVSLDTFADQWLRANPEKFIRKMLVQAGVEASEEVFTEISNKILDAANRGVNSDHEHRVRQLMNDPENPLNETEARQKAACEDAMDVFWAGFGGFLSGGMSSFGGAIADGTRQQQVGQDIISRTGQGDVLSAALELRPNDKTAQNLQGKLDAGSLTGKNGQAKATDARRLGGLAERNAADMTGKDAAAVTEAIRNRAEEIGSPGDSQALAEAIWKQMTGEKLSLSDRYTLRMNQQITEQIEGEIFSVGTGEKADNGWVKSVGTYSIAPGTFGARELQSQKSARQQMEQTVSSIFGKQAPAVMMIYNQGQNRGSFVDEVTKVFRAGQEGRALESVSGISTLTAEQKEIAYQVGQDSTNGESFDFDKGAEGQSYLKSDHSPVNITGFSKIGDGGTVLLTDEGERVDADSVKFGDYSTARLYRTIADMGLDAAGANELLQGAKESGLSPAAFAVAAQEAYISGRNGIGLDKLSRDSTAMRLNETVRKAAWEAGSNSQQRQNAGKQAVIDKGKHGKKAGGLTLEDSAKAVKNLNSQQRSALDVSNVLAAMGLNVTVYASTEAQRKAGMENGNIRLSDGGIRVDLNAGMEGQGVMAWALSHEFTHFVEEMSPEKFHTFTDILFEELSQKNIDADGLIQAKAQELRGMEAHKNLSENKLQNLAYSEAVAEMMETELTDTDAISRISQKLQQEDKSLWGKIKNFLKGLVDRLKEAYRGLTPDSRIAATTREAIASSEAILNAYVDAAADAVENYNLQEGQKNNAPEGVRYSQRYLEVAENQDIAELTKRVLSGNFKASEKVYLGTMSTENAARVQEITGINVDGFRVAIEARQIEHILNRHGEQGTSDHSMANVSDIAKIQYTLDSPDSITAAGKTSAYVSMRNGRNRPSDTVLYEKNIGTKSYYTVQAVADTKAKTLHIVTAFIGDSGYKKGTPQFTNTLSPGATSEIAAVDAPSHNVPQAAAEVKEDLKKSSSSQVQQEGQKNTAQEGVQFMGRKAHLFNEAEVAAIQTIGRKSLNEFTSSDIQATEKIAEIYWVEMREKSPFFRAWFGDWRANDQAPVHLAIKKGDTRGVIRNDDTGWEIAVSGQVFNETKNHTGRKNIAARPYLPYINSIIENAVLLDSSGIDRNKKKSPNSLLMHSLYSIADIGNGPELLKMYIEEMNNPGSIATSKRSYQLQNIEKYQMSGQSSPTWTSSLVPSTGTVKTVADLFAVVKRKDSNFKPKQISQIVNEDGTPKIIYHQTGKEFHVFSNANPLSGMNDSETPNGFFAKDNDADIGIGGKKQMALYGDMKKPLHFKNRAAARAWYEKHVDGYAALQKQHDQINRQFQEEYEQQETDSDKYYEENYNAYVANDPAVTNAILENEKKLDDILDSWKAASVSISRQQRELLNEYFLKRDSGYDGIILDVDEGENEKPVKSYIFFNNTQLKSATGNIGTFDKVNQDIRYSSRNPQKQLEAWETENERLKLEVEYLQKVVQIHKQGNRDYTLDKNSLKSQALDLMKSNNAKGDASELAAIMDELYRYFATDENWQWDELQEKAGEAADWLMEHQKHRLEDYAQSALDWMAKRHVRLNDAQIGEIQYQFGSLSEFKKAVKGTIIIDQQADTQLDQLWQEGAEEYGYLFDKSVSDADMPRVFAEVVQGLKDSKSVDQAELEYDRENWRADLTRQVLDKFHQVKPVESVSDKMKQQIQQLKQEHKEAIAQLKSKQKVSLDEVREASKRALAEYRRQRDITFKAKEAVYNAELKLIKQAHEQDMAQLRTQYGEDTKTMQTEFIRLLREYDASGKRNDRLEQRLDEQARKLAGSRENEAVWQREFKRLLREYDASGRSIERLEQKVKDQQAKAKAKVEAAERTAMRGRLQRTLDMLNRYLLKPSKTLYVPDSLQPAVIKAMQAINGVQLGSVKENAVRMKDALESLRTAYVRLMETNEGRFTEEYHSKIMELLDSATETIGDTEYRQLSHAQLEAVYNAYTGILTIIRNENRMFAANLKEGYEETARAAYGEFRGQTSKSRLTSKLMERLEEQSWNNEKPYYAFERLGSEVFMRLYQNLRKGEEVWQRDTSSAEVYAKELMLKYNYDEWTDSLVELESSNGESFRLNLEERLSLYALSKRNQALEHLTHGGFILAESTREVKGPFGMRTERIVRDPRAYALTADAVAAIRDGRNLLKLTQNQMAFADEMQDYLSTVCAEKNNEISRALYGVSLAKEKNYWPLKSSGIKSERIRRSQENPGNRQKNAGHMKATVAHANNTVELTGFMQTWAAHIENTAMYHAFTLPMEDFFRVYNWNAGDGAMGMRQMLMDKHGAAAVAYIDTFLKDLNGGLRADPRESLQNLLLSSFKKSAVSASLSVAIQQPSAVGRAFSVISPKFFAGVKVESNGNLEETWETMKHYAPVVGIKEIGRFDVGMGASTQDLLTGKADKGFMAKVDKATGFLPEYMDKVTWVAIWEAAKRQTKHANPSLRGEALLEKAGELFTECITKTQVYDSVFSRSGNMRSKSNAMKMLTAFMAEPTTTANMAMSAIRDAKNGNWKTAGKKAASLGTALVLNSILASLVYASRDQDEEKTWVEKYLKSLVSELVDGVNPLGYIPGVKDIWSIFQGYDVERSDMSLYADLAKYALKFSQAWQAYNEVDEDDEEAKKAALKKAGITTTDFAAGVMNLMGLPLRNLLRDVRAIGNVVTTKPRQSDRYTKGYAMWQALNDYAPKVIRQKDGKTQELYKAVQSGSQVWIDRMKESYETEDKFNTAVINALMKEDKRIRQAAKAIASGSPGEADKIAQKIAGEGGFTEDQVEAAISKQLKKLPGVSYEALLEEAQAGTDVKETTELLKRCGYTEENIQKKLKEGIQEWYQGGTISKQEAVEKLKTYLGMNQSDISKTVNKWTSKVVTGIEFGDIKEAFLNGDITQSRAIDMYVLYGGYTRDSAAETVNKWGCEKEFGVSSSDLQEAFLNGNISQQTLKRALVKYGGKSSEEAERLASAYAWKKRNPEYDLTISQIEAYTKPISTLGYSLENAGVKPDVYRSYLDRAKQCKGEDANGDGRTDSGSVKNQKMEVINALPISREQKDALYYAEGWSARDIHKAPWH